MFTRLTATIILQYTHISNHYAPKTNTMLYFNCISIKIKENWENSHREEPGPQSECMNPISPTYHHIPCPASAFSSLKWESRPPPPGALMQSNKMMLGTGTCLVHLRQTGSEEVAV